MEDTASWLSAVRFRTYSFCAPLPGSILHLDYPDPPESMGQLLRRIRLDLRLQIKQVAQETGINEWTIINWEKGRCAPRRRLPDKVRRFYSNRGHPFASQLAHPFLEASSHLPAFPASGPS